MSDEVLRTELAYFNAHREEFLKKAEGLFVVIHGEMDYGFYPTEQEAYHSGAQRFGIKPFLIKEVRAEDETQETITYTLGLIDASF